MSDRSTRERLVRGGAGVMNDGELLSLLIGSGHENLLDGDATRGLARLGRMTFNDLRMEVGAAKAATLCVAFELGRRVANQGMDGTPQTIRTNEDVVSIFRPQLEGLPHEEFWVLFLSGANTVVGREKVGQGGVGGVVVDHRLVVKRAVELLASAVVLVHNHPTGVAEPSAEDGEITGRIAQAAKLFDIEVVDHLIIARGSSFSFRHAGLL